MIDTLGNVKQLLHVTATDDDPMIEQLQTIADEVIHQSCGRIFTGGTFTETFSGSERTLFLKNYPVASIVSLTVDGVARTSDTYTLFADRGVLVTRGRSFGSDGEIVYTTAANAVPPSICRAYADLIGEWYRHAKTMSHLGQLNVISRNENGIETRYLNGTTRLAIPKAVQDVLELFREPQV
jgi:hypothetical protein